MTGNRRQQKKMANGLPNYTYASLDPFATKDACNSTSDSARNSRAHHPARPSKCTISSTVRAWSGTPTPTTTETLSWGGVRRDAQNERDGAGLRISVAAATPSQLRSSAARTMSGRRGRAAPRKSLSSLSRENLLATFYWQKGGPPLDKPCFFKINLPKELRSLP